MSEKDNVEKGESVETPQGTPPAKETTPEQSEEVTKLEAKKAELEEQVSGLEGTVNSLKEDIVRKRQERKGVDDEQQPVIDEEALLAKLDSKLEERIQPVLKENEILRKAVLKSNEESLKAKKQALDSINARIASATSSRPSASQDLKKEDEVELPAEDLKLAKELGLENLRYMKDVEVL